MIRARKKRVFPLGGPKIRRFCEGLEDGTRATARIARGCGGIEPREFEVLEDSVLTVRSSNHLFAAQGYAPAGSARGRRG
jgi:hypothetical protein